MNEIIDCIKCGGPMPKLRFTLYKYKDCISCSTVGTYTAVTTINGEGDHTWNDIMIMDTDQFKRYEEHNKEKK
jgi:hypothetical protein